MPAAPATLAPVRLAIGQIRMHWTLEGNLDEMRRAMRLARAQGADGCVFPELALPGFHRQIASLARAELIAPAIESLAGECARLSLAIAFGAPTFEGACVRNSYLVFDHRGRRTLDIHKNGLTDPEATFFVRGTQRPTAMLCGLPASAVICREIEDEEAVCRQLEPEAPKLLLWPGQMRPDPELPACDPPGHVVQAQHLAARLNAHVVQANWPNALNRPEESAGCGHSAVIDPTGTLLFRAPRAEPGVAVFTLGERRWEWFGGG